MPADASYRKGTIQGYHDGKWLVALQSPDGCAVCHKGLCSSDEERVVEVSCMHQAFFVGQPVWVKVKHTTGLRAIMIFYGIPVLLMLATLVTLTSVGFGEGVAGITALLLLLPFYLVLHATRRWWSAGITLALDKV